MAEPISITTRHLAAVAFLAALFPTGGAIVTTSATTSAAQARIEQRLDDLSRRLDRIEKLEDRVRRLEIETAKETRK